MTAAPQLHEYDLQARYEAETGRVFLTGIQALVRVPFDQIRADRRAGRTTAAFVSGYPGSPLGGFDQELARQRALASDLQVVHEPGLNEELAATSVMGSQMVSSFGGPRYDGVVGVWYGKAPGLDRASDAIRTASYPGTTRLGGALAYVGDDPACKSSTLPSGSHQAMADLNMAVLYPGTTQEVLDFGLHGIAMSRASGLWTGLKVVTPVADGSGTVEVDPDRLQFTMPVDADGKMLGRDEPGSLSPLSIVATEREILEQRLPAALRYGVLNEINRVTHDPRDAWLGIVAPGHVYYEVIEALHQLGLSGDDLERRGIRLLRVGMMFPFDGDTVRSFARGLRRVVVVEEKRSYLEAFVRDALYNLSDRPPVCGKADSDGVALIPGHGTLDANALLTPLHRTLLDGVDAEVLRAPASAGQERARLSLIPRTPYFCSGCPHNTSLPVPAGSRVGAGIGCHSMVAFLDPERAGMITGVTMMGGEGAQWIGAAPFVETDHIFQNLGDGTYFHSGSLAVRASVAAKHNITYKILYNRAVAMTGGQDAVGAAEVPDIARALVAEGVARVMITTEDRSRYHGVALPKGVVVWDRSRIVEAQELLRATPGVTVLIHDQQCAAEARRLRKRGQQVDPATRVVINERVCEGCGDCGVQSNCLSLQPIDTDFGEKTRIDQTSCNKDYSCLDGDCPSFLTVTPIEELPRWRRRVARLLRAGRRLDGSDASDAPTAELPEPTPVVPTDDFTIRMPGIGGTGVVTVAQILGTAAMLDGYHVASADQTGLSQKGGAVVSDLHISSKPVEGANKVVDGDLDLYLVFDMIGALTPANLDAADPAKTVAVASTTKTATGLQIGRPGLRQPPLSAQRAVLDGATRAELNVFLDAGRIARDLLGSATPANLVMLGAAFQRGAIPIRAESIERAIELNGVAVESNRRAFAWGRHWVVDPARVEDAIVGGGRSPERADVTVVDLVGRLGEGTELSDVLARCVPDLIEYQDRAYAEHYLAVVRRVAEAEGELARGGLELATTVAHNLHKLLAYKDEYEVARLLLSGAADGALQEAAAGREVLVSWNLHPPFLRSLGMDRKLRLGPWFGTVLRTLRSARGLRGTRLDLFGYARVRRVERELVDEYLTAIDAAIATLNDDNHSEAVALAALPDLVRGYEDVKLANVERYREKLASSLDAIGGP